MNPRYPVIAERANHRCEYCHAPELVFNFPFEVEHIIPLSRTGSDEELNLALACRSCNLRKGTRISGISPDVSTQVPFFHPRHERWKEHFWVDAYGITIIEKVTVENLEINSASQIAARKLWIHLDLFP